MARRRRIIELPTSRLAVWSLRVAVFGLVVTLLAILIVRGGFLEFKQAMASVAGALAVEAVAMLLAVGGLVVIWNEGSRGLRHALLTVFIVIAVLGYPAYLGVSVYKKPALNDITTDFDDPPRFEAVQRLRPRDANPVAYPGAPAAELQSELFPDIESLRTTATPPVAFKVAVAAITKRKWRIIDERPPAASRDGHIEAIARTLILGLRDDVVVRIRAAEGGAVIDVRSASRYGTRDFGSNASRVKSLLDDINAALATQLEK